MRLLVKMPIPTSPKSLRAFKELIQKAFTNTLNDIDDQVQFFDNSKSLKGYLIENNNDYVPRLLEYNDWVRLDDAHTWYYATHEKDPNKYVYYDNSLGRVGILYTLLKVDYIDNLIKRWIAKKPNLDHCWLSKKQLLSYSDSYGWEEKGIGLKYRDLLSKLNKGDDYPTLSLKAWYGSSNGRDWEDTLAKLRKESALSSIRWSKRVDSITTLTFEWYNYGKVTVSFAEDVDEVLQAISAMARRYKRSLEEATQLRDKKLCAFELNFSKKVDINAFSEHVETGRSSLKLWLMETESSKDFKRFRGVDLHTWDPIYIDMTPEYAFLPIPIGGCVNAAPRIAVKQGENSTGDTGIQFDGVDVFV